jgi:hypothetical protein
VQAEEEDPELIDATATPTAANSADTTPTSWVVGPCGLSSAGLDFLFHMFFLARYCRLLEEGSFRGRTADFLYMLVFGEPPPPCASTRCPGACACNCAHGVWAHASVTALWHTRVYKTEGAAQHSSTAQQPGGSRLSQNLRNGLDGEG